MTWGAAWFELTGPPIKHELLRPGEVVELEKGVSG